MFLVLQDFEEPQDFGYEIDKFRDSQVEFLGLILIQTSPTNTTTFEGLSVPSCRFSGPRRMMDLQPSMTTIVSMLPSNFSSQKTSSAWKTMRLHRHFNILIMVSLNHFL